MEHRLIDPYKYVQLISDKLQKQFNAGWMSFSRNKVGTIEYSSGKKNIHKNKNKQNKTETTSHLIENFFQNGS